MVEYSKLKEPSDLPQVGEERRVLRVFLRNHLKACFKVLFKPKDLVLEVCHAIDDARMVINTLLCDGHQLNIVLLFRKKGQCLDHQDDASYPLRFNKYNA